MNTREKCYKCFRPMSSCMCKHTKALYTNTLFVIIMHPKEFGKTKNGTGILTHLNLTNSIIYKGIDFTYHEKVNEIINNPMNECYLLYPSSDAINISEAKLPKNKKQKVLFLVDSTWPCSKTIINRSKNLQKLTKMSFTPTCVSQFAFKTQPNSYCLSTIETTQTILNLFNTQELENLTQQEIEYFIKPFEKMVEYQLGKAQNIGNVRYKPPYKK